MNKKKILFQAATVALVLLIGALLLSGCPAEEPEEPERIVSLAANEEFVVDENGLNMLNEEYGLKFGAVHEMAIGLTHEALRSGDVEAAIGFTTDAMILEYDLVSLIDDKQVFPANNPAPLFREEVLDRYPHIESIMSEVTAKLDTETKKRLNHRASIEEKTPEEVARKWLIEEELIAEEERTPFDGEPVTIRSIEFTEDRILRHILVLVLENARIPVEDKKQMVGAETIRAALLAGEIDAYWEYTGVAWREYHLGEEMISDPDELFKKVAEKDAEKELVWLDYAQMNKTYTVMVRREHAREYDLSTISDLAEWVKQVQAGDLQ